MSTATRQDPITRGLRRLNGFRYDEPPPDFLSAIQPLVSVALTVAALWTVRPLGWSGWALVGTALLVVNVVVIFTRLLPQRYLGDRARLALMCVGGISAGLLFAYDPASAGQSFGYFVVIYSGVVFEQRKAVAIALLTSLTAGIALAVRDINDAPWWIAAVLGLSSLLGMMRRSHLERQQTNRELAERQADVLISQARAQQLADRAELARTIHDVLAHSLSGLNMQLSATDALLSAGRVDEGQEAVRKARGMVVDGITETRRAVQALRDETLELVPTLTAMVQAPPVADEQVTVSGVETALTTQQVQCVVRIAQEALTNARRHAPGAPVRIALDRGGHRLVLNVQNGPAPTPSHFGSGSGLGLIGMRERAAQCDGTLSAQPIASGPNAGGWRVRLEIPLVPAGSGADIVERTDSGEEDQRE